MPLRRTPTPAPRPTPKGEPIIVSRPSLQALAEDLDKHADAKHAASREARVAKEHGDLSENAEYKASKEKFRLAGRLQQRVGRELKRLQDQGYTVVDPLEWATAAGTPERVEVGVVARVKQRGFSEDYLLAGAKDINLPLDAKLVGVPYTSPLGQALMRRVPPTKFTADIAGESRELEIESLRRPTRAELEELYPEIRFAEAGKDDAE